MFVGQYKQITVYNDKHSGCEIFESTFTHTIFGTINHNDYKTENLTTKKNMFFRSNNESKFVWWLSILKEHC